MYKSQQALFLALASECLEAVKSGKSEVLVSLDALTDVLDFLNAADDRPIERLVAPDDAEEQP